MSFFRELIRQRPFNYAAKELMKDEHLTSEITDWLEANGFSSLQLSDAGTQSIILNVEDNPAYVIRITRKRRPLVPHVIQPICSKKFGTALTLEIVPNIEAPISLKNQLEEEFYREVGAAGYDCDTYNYHGNVGVFEFLDTKKRMWRVPMAMDGNMIYTSETPPTCTSNYPPLSVQWEKQSEIVKGDERLQKILRDKFGSDIPPKLPLTKIIRAPSQTGKMGI